jgi:hypothetical protein
MFEIVTKRRRMRQVRREAETDGASRGHREGIAEATELRTG